MSLPTYLLAILAAVSMGTSIVLESAQRANFLRKVSQDRQREIEWQRERDMMAVIFHEVRNPLNGTVGHLRLTARSTRRQGGGDRVLRPSAAAKRVLDVAGEH